MAILTLGISFRRAPIELLERLAFTDDDLTKAYRRAHDLDGVDGAVILSTCNRVEVYGDVANYHAGFLALKRLLVETRHVAPEELGEPLYSHWEQDAADHLFAVASGLDSMVLGETQIYAQVREALAARRRRGCRRPRPHRAVPCRRRAPDVAHARKPRSAPRPTPSWRWAPTSPARRSAGSRIAMSWSWAPGRWRRWP